MRSFSAATRTLTATTPELRSQTTTFDAQGRVTGEQISGLYPVSYVYDSKGLLASIAPGISPCDAIGIVGEVSSRDPGPA